MHGLSLGGTEPPSFLQVVGNKWETYLELLQLEYSEGCALRLDLGNRTLSLHTPGLRVDLSGFARFNNPVEHRHGPQHALQSSKAGPPLLDHRRKALKATTLAVIACKPTFRGSVVK
jgi:hypothetical protein